MNLIEQLGGYENSRGLLNLYEYSISFKYYKEFGGDFESAGHVDVFVLDLKDALLEYRRQHNIFEVGDKVVFKDGSHALDRCDLGSGEVLVIKDIDFYDYLIFECSPHGHGQKWFRHATTKEIAAGRRL